MKNNLLIPAQSLRIRAWTGSPVRSRGIGLGYSLDLGRGDSAVKLASERRDDTGDGA